MKRTIFQLSDRTGLTVEALAHSLLTQFEGVEFETVACPYLDSPDKAREVAARIDAAARRDGARPLVFCTLLDPELRKILSASAGLLIDFFDTFIVPLEAELGIRSSHAVGRTHGVGSNSSYQARIDAVNFALANDDGADPRHYPDADIILVGVSRTGKTPTCLYFALQFGIRAANYPLTEEDFATAALPAPLAAHRQKLYGLTIQAERLQRIRHERRPGSRYAAAAQCQLEIRHAEELYRREGIPFLDTSTMSIEEIATTIMHRAGLTRRLHT